MATTKREKLFTEFPPVSTEQWEEVIKADLKGADYERKLVWKTPEGFNVRPYYRAENLAGLKFLGSEAGVFPYVRGTRAHNRWKIHQTVIVNCPKEANAVALKILNAGVDSIEFQIVPETFSAEDLNTLLKDIHIPAVEITFSGSKTAHVAELVIAKIEKEQLPAEEVHINFCIDPLVKKLTSKGSFCSENGAKCFEKIADLVRKTKTYKGIRVITVSGEIFSNAGSTIVEALAFSLAAGHDYLVRLMDMGFTIEEAAKKIRFSQAITSNYFMEIAKLRAGRMLWANIVKAYNPAKNCPCKMFTHAVTSTWNQTAYDPYVNMLRGTTEAMSASIAGVHSLEVTPFNKAYEDPNEFSMRIARNVELLLKHESHFDQVVDPVHLHADLAGIRKDKAAFQRFHNAYCLFGQKYRRGSTANKNRHHLILPVFRRCLLYFTAQCLYILLLHVRTLQPGQEITVETFPYTKWYMKIQAQILFHLFIIQL